jgi:Zn-dependent protease with chaperone function
VDFFQRQERARGATAKLTILFLLSVVAVVAVIDLLVYLAVPATTASGRAAAVGLATVVTVLIIGGGTLSKMASLRGGGASLALSMGAIPIDPTTADPLLRRYVHVVEEMSIASGVAMPALFVLPNDPGINPFAAGHSPADAVITVTVGALQTLNRDELQGVIGHEFSHILNGDMRINIRMIGVLGGLLVRGLVGLRILQFGGRGRDKNVGPILAFGVAALVLGFVGQFLAGLVKAAMSRQREWLADAASIQFTRQTQGLTDALKKIAGLPEGSELVDASSEKQINHMLFGDGRRPFLQLWATHPPLDARIRALDPTFSAQQLQQLKSSYAAARPNGLTEDAQLGLVEAPPRAPMPGGPGPGGPAPAAPPPVTVDPAAVSAAVGTFTLADLERAAALSQQLDPRLRELAGAATSAVPLVLALLLEPAGPVRDRQLQALEQRVGPHILAEVTAVLPEVAALTPQLRLPLVGIALPALAARPLDQIAAVQATLQALVLGDSRYTLFEYCRPDWRRRTSATGWSPGNRVGRGGPAWRSAATAR